MGVVSAIIVALLVAAVVQLLRGSPPAEQLRRYISSKQADGWQLIVGRQVQLQVAGDRSWLMVFRDSRGHRSDELDVLTQRSGALRQAFAFQAAPQRPREARVPPDPRHGVFNVRLEAVTDLMGATGAEQALLTLGGPDYHLRYPIILWVDQFSRTVHLSPAFTGGVTIGPRAPRVPAQRPGVFLDPVPPSRTLLTGFRLVRTLYSMRTRLRDVANREPPIVTLGADSVALLHRDGQVFLAAGFVVAETNRRPAIEQDSDCIMNNQLDQADLARPGGVITPYSCGTDPQAPHPPVPAYLNMKAWRFDRQGVSPATTFCGGRAFIARAQGAGNRRPLRENWASYFKAGRLC